MEPDARLSPEQSPLPSYYKDIHNSQIHQAIKDFDDTVNFDKFNREVRNPNSGNFLVDFGDDEAWCGFNLDASAYRDLLRAVRPSALNTRWINIWLPYAQKHILNELAKFYDFSPRLLGLMRSDPIKLSERSRQASRESSKIFRRAYQHVAHPHRHSLAAPLPLYGIAEEGIGMNDIAAQPEHDMLAGMNHYRIVDEVWHWQSVDWGRRYVCLGYNSLYNVQTNLSDHDDDIEPDVHRNQDLPTGKRVWTWLILTEDKTVISIHEDPFPGRYGVLDQQEMQTNIIIRRNLINVFHQLSKAFDSRRHNAIEILPIRNRVGDSEEETLHRPADSPGLLFYCLFDDWLTTYNLVARREHQYAAELNKLREAMLKKAELRHIDRLNHIGRQLAVLKRIYQSYETIIDRVLEKQEATLASLKNSQFVASGPDSLASSHPALINADSPESLLGVSLSSAARVRFERLKYRIRLYALSEINECLDQKESLVMMNFNLIAIKESYSVERLTRITLLLAKVTILFMPVSLMTAYFSTQLENVHFTVQKYWTAFAVILSTSIIALVIFSFVSGTMEGKMFYRPLSRRIVDVSKVIWAEIRRKRRARAALDGATGTKP